MGIVIFSNIVDLEYIITRKVTKPLKKYLNRIIIYLDINADAIKKVKNRIKNETFQLYATSLQEIMKDIAVEKLRLNELDQQ